MSSDPLTAIVAALEKQQIIPDIIPVSHAFMPSVLFSVVYPNGAEVNLGNEITPEETQDEPEIRLAALNGPWDDAPETSYTLAMLDPGAPYRTDAIYRSFRHWVITGLKKSPAITSDSAEALNALKTHPSTTPYRPPGPRPNSGIHRYTFLLFREPAGSERFTVPQGAPECGAALEERRSWDPIAFAEKYGLKLIGANYSLVASPEVDPSE